MRRRAKRDMSILGGVVVILGSVIFFNGQMTRMNSADEYDNWRREAEQAKRNEGFELLSWDLLRKTKGSLRKGGKYAEELFEHNQQHVNLMGYMVPEESFRDVTEFLFLPLPIECYFCQIPPARDVMHVTLKEGETAQIYEEPVLVNGTFNVHEDPGVKYFYSITEASLGPGDIDGALNRRQMNPDHLIPNHDSQPDLIDPKMQPYDSN